MGVNDECKEIELYLFEFKIIGIKSFYDFFISAHNVVHNNRYQEWGHYIMTFFVRTLFSAAVRELHVYHLVADP